MAKDSDVAAEIQPGEHPDNKQWPQHQMGPAQEETDKSGRKNQGQVHRCTGQAIGGEAFSGRKRRTEVREHGQFISAGPKEHATAYIIGTKLEPCCLGPVGWGLLVCDQTLWIQQICDALTYLCPRFCM